LKLNCKNIVFTHVLEVHVYIYISMQWSYNNCFLYFNCVIHVYIYISMQWSYNNCFLHFNCVIHVYIYLYAM